MDRKKALLDVIEAAGETAIKNCPSCAALRGEVAQWKCAAAEDAQLLKEARERIKVLEEDNAHLRKELHERMYDNRPF